MPAIIDNKSAGTHLQPEILDKSKKLMTVFVILASALAGALYGLDIGVIGGALDPLTAELKLTSAESGLIVGAVLYGGAVAMLITGFLADIFGRQKMIVISAFIFIVGVIFSAYCHHFSTLLVGRLVMGIGVGVSAILVPLYLSETAPSKVRGTAVACFQLFLTGGILLAYLIDLAFTASGNWRAMFLVLIFPGLLLFLLAIFLPESPTWLFMKKRFEKSKKVLMKFHSESNADLIIADMTALKEEKVHAPNKTIFKKAYVVPFVIAFLIANFNQTTGINCVLQYAPKIFSDSGVNSPVLAVLLGTGITVINFFVTLIATSIIDKFGRKPLLTLSTAGVVISLVLMGIASMMSVSNLKIIILTIGTFGFILSFAFGCGVVVWLAMSELLPTSIRSKGLAICLFGNSMISSILATIFPVLKDSIGYSGLFFVLAGFTVLYFIVAKFFLPETKGKTIEEIEEYWVSKYEKKA